MFGALINNRRYILDKINYTASKHIYVSQGMGISGTHDDYLK